MHESIGRYILGFNEQKSNRAEQRGVQFELMRAIIDSKSTY